jgi:hypothetical protein
MGWVAEIMGMIRGAGGEPAGRAIGDVETALRRLADERGAARAAVAEAMAERDELLIVDETDKKIAALDAAADRHRLTLERCEKLEPILLDELQALRTEAKRARWRELLGKYEDAAIAYAGALRVAVTKMHVMLDVNEEARRHGFEHEVAAAFIPPTRMVSIEALDIFEAAVERARDAAAPKPPPPAPAATPPPPAPVPKAPPKPKPPRPAQAQPKEFPPPKPDADGRVPIVFVRAGMELEGRPRPRVAEVVLLPEEQARAIVMSGAADYADVAA